MNASEIKHSIYSSDMNLFQIVAVSICVLISFIDGYDVLTIAFVAPTIAAQWGLMPQQLGILFSAGLAGMVLGALFVSPFADKFGRRFIILFCLLILSAGMFGSGLSTTLNELVFFRIFTGLGMGAILPGINTVVAEYSSNQSRSFAISIMAAGYTVGSVIGGIISIYLIRHFGWQYVFFFGGAFSCLMIPAVFYQLPESLDFMLSKKNQNGLNKLNSLLKRLGLKPCQTFPQYTENAVINQKKWQLLLSPQILRNMILLCLSNFMLMCTFYFLANWTPKILVSLGYSTDVSIASSLVMNILGIIGGVMLGWFSKKYSVQKITGIMLLVAFISISAFGLCQNVLPILIVLIAFIGFFIFGAMAGLYATAPIVFPAEIRATGTGIVLGLARFGATLGPYLAGLLIAAEFTRGVYFFILALPLVIAACCIFAVRKN